MESRHEYAVTAWEEVQHIIYQDGIVRGDFKKAYNWLCLVVINGHSYALYNETEKARQQEIQNVQVEEKRSTRKYSGAKSSAYRDRKFKEKTGAKWNKGSDDLRTRFHLAKVPTFERN